MFRMDVLLTFADVSNQNIYATQCSTHTNTYPIIAIISIELN